MRSLMMEVDEFYAWLIVLYNLVCTSLANLEKNKPTRICAKILKVSTYSFYFLAKETQ
jgi:hypothetical protein